MRLGVIGINEKVAPLQLREVLAKVCRQQFDAEISPADATPLVVLSTCNRTELYFSTHELADTHAHLLHQLRQLIEEDFDQQLYSFFGRDCFHHLARVSAGLDSAIIAETEIQGQVRLAYESASQRRALPHDLHFAFQKALKIGKQVRARLPLTRGIPDVEHAIYWAGQQVFSSPRTTRVLFVGASEINRKIIGFFERKGVDQLTLCNRSHHKAFEVAQRHDVSVLPWEQLHHWPSYDWVIMGTKAAHHLISQEDIGPHMRTRLIMDLGVPRNVDPDVALAARLHLLNIDQLQDLLQVRRSSLGPLLNEAEQLVMEATSRAYQSFQKRIATREALLAEALVAD